MQGSRVSLAACSSSSAFQEWLWLPEHRALHSQHTGECLTAPGEQYEGVRLRPCISLAGRDTSSATEASSQSWYCSKKGHLTSMGSGLHLSATQESTLVFLSREHKQVRILQRAIRRSFVMSVRLNHNHILKEHIAQYSELVCLNVFLTLYLRAGQQVAGTWQPDILLQARGHTFASPPCGWIVGTWNFSKCNFWYTHSCWTRSGPKHLSLAVPMLSYICDASKSNHCHFKALLITNLKNNKLCYFGYFSWSSLEFWQWFPASHWCQAMPVMLKWLFV